MFGSQSQVTVHHLRKAGAGTQEDGHTTFTGKSKGRLDAFLLAAYAQLVFLTLMGSEPNPRNGATYVLRVSFHHNNQDNPWETCPQANLI